MKRICLTAIFLLCLTVHAFTLDFALRLSPSLAFPQEEDLGLGFSGIANFDIDLLNFLTLGVEGGYSAVKQESLDENFNIAMGGVSAGIYYFPLSRLYVSANGSLGLHSTSINAPSVTDDGKGMYWRAFGEIGFRFTPAFTLSATGGYEQFYVGGEKLFATPTAGLSAKFTFSTSKNNSKDNFFVLFEQDSFVLPAFASVYRSTPLGTAVVRNTSSAEVRDVHISFRAGKYTASEKECFSCSILPKYKKIEVPVLADFSPELLRFSEDGKINGELVISYKFLGKRMQEVQDIVLDVKHRNTFSWNDPASLACFIDSGTPEILEAAKYLAGAEITNLKTGMNSAFQYAAAVVEGLRLAGIVYSQDSLTPYIAFRSGEQLDEIQYPLQTLNLLSGDYDDIGILICSCLESVGVGTGFIPLEDDFIVLVDTGVSPEKKANQFGEDSVIADQNTTWICLSMKSFSKGFTQSRLDASKKLKALPSFELVDVHAAWEVYPPVTFSGYRGSYKNPGKDALIRAVNEDVNFYINNDLATLIKKFRAEGNTKLLADTYVRSGMYDQAIAEYQKLSSIASMNNMGLAYMAKKNYRSALAQYNKVLAKDPQNRIALANVKKIQLLIGE